MADSLEIFRKGASCAQSVLAGNCALCGLSRQTALKIAAPFGAGVGRMRHICGALSGALMVAGLKYATAEISKEEKARIYKMTRIIAKRFKEKNGSIICADLLGLDISGKDMFSLDDSAEPSDRNSSYYASRPCLKIIASAAELREEFVKSGEFEKERM